MNSPYINTYLTTTVSLAPRYLNNDINKHIKSRLIEKLQGRYYKQYGYIKKIYNIEKRDKGEIINEDPSSSIFYNILFSCKLCRPLNNSIIICKINTITRSIIHLTNGPIVVMILEAKEDINNEKFIYDDETNTYIARIGNSKGIEIKQGMYMKVTIIESISKRDDRGDIILCFGSLHSLATEEEINTMIKQEEDDDMDFIDYDKYIDTEIKNNLNNVVLSDDEEKEIEDENAESKISNTSNISNSDAEDDNDNDNDNVSISTELTDSSD